VCKPLCRKLASGGRTARGWNGGSTAGLLSGCSRVCGRAPVRRVMCLQTSSSVTPAPCPNSKFDETLKTSAIILQTLRSTAPFAQANPFPRSSSQCLKVTPGWIWTSITNQSWGGRERRRVSKRSMLSMPRIDANQAALRRNSDARRVSIHNASDCLVVVVTENESRNTACR